MTRTRRKEVNRMSSITVGRYAEGEAVTAEGEGWSGWVEPEDRTWILFLDNRNRPHLYRRDPATGAVTGEAHTIQ